MLSSQEIRTRFLKFFESKDHHILPSASLITTDVADATNATLFNTAGMQPLIPYLLGEKHPQGTRLASSQKCVRTGDLDEVGDKTHLSFFEMLGNWSLGDYFKEEAIQYSYEFLTDKEVGLGLDKERLYVTVFAGNDLVPKDSEAIEIWKRYVPEHRIYLRDQKDNWWTAGENSPAGPSTEMFYDIDGGLGDMTSEEFEQADEDQKVVEIWNDVFMTYRQERGEIVGALPQKNVDTGAGLERVCTVVQGVSCVYETDLFKPLMNTIKEHATSYDEVHARIIADHIKTSVFMLNDGVVISNTGRGYVLRRMLRRAYSSMEHIGFPESQVKELVHAVVEMYGDLYFEGVNEAKIAAKIKVIATELDKVIAIIKRGNKVFAKLARDGVERIDGKFLAELRQTQGLPLSISRKLAQKHKINLKDNALDEYHALTKKHQATSRKAAEGKFKGGLSEDTPKIRALHTATHLMLAGLREHLGDSVKQRGSHINEERTRFDFTYDKKVEKEILEKVENYVNDAISSGCEVCIETLPKNIAEQDPSITASFWERYPDEVTVYNIQGEDVVYSRELCGGPHVESLMELKQYGRFVILKEESSSAGVRRIKAGFQE